MIHESHQVFTEHDFTPEEIARRNELAVAVIEGGLITCMVCGRSGDALTNSCLYNQWEKKVRRRGEK